MSSLAPSLPPFCDVTHTFLRCYKVEVASMKLVESSNHENVMFYRHQAYCLCDSISTMPVALEVMPPGHSAVLTVAFHDARLLGGSEAAGREECKAERNCFICFCFCYSCLFVCNLHIADWGTRPTGVIALPGQTTTSQRCQHS